jgi:hypothetical protein
VKRLNKKVFVTVLALSLAVIIAVAAVVPALAHSNQCNDDNNDSPTNYGSGGSVHVQLPQGEPSHPTTLQIDVYDINRWSSFGAMDVMMVWLWVPSMNIHAPVALISDNPNPAFFDFAETLFSNTPVWIPAAGMTNIFQVADEELEVSKRGDVLTANLTAPIAITLPDPLGGSFTFPPTALEFRGFDTPFREENVLPGYSEQTTITQPAWVRLWIPEWTGGAIATEYVGTLWLYMKRTYTLPSAP